MTKVCSRCLQRQPLTAFYQDQRYRFGVTGQCRDCRNQVAANWATGNKLKHLTGSAAVKTRKRCITCKLEKPITEFSKMPGKRDGFASRCKSCRNSIEGASRLTTTRWKSNHLWSHYRMTIQDLQAMVDRQGGVCAICQQAWRRPVLDHCHDTGAVRGVLCDRCNNWLTPLEQPEFIANASRYLVHARNNPSPFSITHSAAATRQRQLSEYHANQ